MTSHSLIVLLLSALVPLITGALWYSKALFANSWMRANRFLPEDMKGGNMALTFGLTFVLSFLLSLGLSSIVIHQLALHSIVANDHTAAAKDWLDKSMAAYGSNFRTFKHGAFHGALTSIFIGLPIIGVIAMFEKRGWKYVLIHLGYWFVTLALMGGVICQWA